MEPIEVASLIRRLIACRAIIFIISMVFCCCSQADTLQPFVSDGCSSFPDGTLEQKSLWLNCCQKHDYTYWKGGSYQERLIADQALKSCVTTLGEPVVSVLMLAGVRVGGSPLLPANFRWGYGWSYPRLYGQLTLIELEQVKNLSKAIPQSIKDNSLP